MFHISLPKPFVGDLEQCQPTKFSELVVDSHPIIVPSEIVRYRIIAIKGHQVEQVLVTWAGGSDVDRSWEDLKWVCHLNPQSNLEDKVRAKGVGDVMVGIDQVVATTQLKLDLCQEL